MYAIRKPNKSGVDVFVALPTTGLAQPLSVMSQWLMDHKTSFGFKDGRPVGVYLSSIDAVAFKLRFGL
jgi:hypothetical protein